MSRWNLRHSGTARIGRVPGAPSPCRASHGVLSVDDERLSPLDTAFLRLESPGAPMHLGALAVFHPRERVPPGRLAALLGERVARIPAMRQRVRTTWLPPGGAAWAPDPAFEMSRHLHVHRLRRGTAMAAVAGELMAEPLDLDRPLWQLHLLTGLSEGRFAVLVKLHHAMADGLRTVELGLRLMDGRTDGGPARPEPADAPALDGAAGGAVRLARALGQAAETVAGSVGIATSVLSHVRLAALLPSAVDHARPSATARRLVLVRLDTRDVRRVRRLHGGTEHDVLLAVVTGAFRQWLTANDQCPERLGIRAFIPVSRRSRTTGPKRHNVLSGYLCDLPIEQPDPVTALRTVRTTMDRNKAAGFSRGPGAFPVLADRMPAPAQRLTVPLLRRAGPLLFDTTITNVPIPARPMTLAGAPLRHVYPIAPLAHGQALGIALSTYRESVHIGLHADDRAVPDLDRIADGIPAALAALSGSPA
ncbi:wax ester/triacylglycerol synthase family O-acyltransferase [Dactylosporangium roseum]|uniref:wax ester/triacylglycerol synthase family O-acyltransferase n=2 Tax=Dactylosporangium roseum TaxID=47989 RepID=UPI0031D39AEB